MICLMCRQAETAPGRTAVTLERGEMKVIVHNIPAHVCLHCGEAYLEEAVALRLLQRLEDKSIAGELQRVYEYELL